MPRLASEAVEGKSGRNHPTSHQHPIHIDRMARNAYIRVGWYEGVIQLPGLYGEGVLFITTLSCVALVQLPIGRRRRSILNMFNIARRPPDEAPTADSGSGTHSHWPGRQHRGVGSANVKRAYASKHDSALKKKEKKMTTLSITVGSDIFVWNIFSLYSLTKQP